MTGNLLLFFWDSNLFVKNVWQKEQNHTIHKALNTFSRLCKYQPHPKYGCENSERYLTLFPYFYCFFIDLFFFAFANLS